MKRIICVLLIILLCFGMFACSGKNYQNPVSFYYPLAEIDFKADDSVISSEKREGADSTGSYSALLRQYLKGPASSSLRSPFPEGTYLISAIMSDGTLIISLSDAFASLTGLDLTLACSCLALTAFEISNANAVQISTVNEPLDGEEHIIITKDSIILTVSIPETTEE